MVVINSVLLPRELRPHWLIRIGLVLIGVFFATVATVAAYDMAQKKFMKKDAPRPAVKQAACIAAPPDRIFC